MGRKAEELERVVIDSGWALSDEALKLDVFQFIGILAFSAGLRSSRVSGQRGDSHA